MPVYRRPLRSDELYHHGVKGQKWGVRNGPPYPINRNQRKKQRKPKVDNMVLDAIESGIVSKTINRDKQKKHTLKYHETGRSFLHGNFDFAQSIVDEYAGTGEVKMDRNGNWTRKEAIIANRDIGTYCDSNDGYEKTNAAMIIYSKTGTHIYPRKRGLNES